MNLLFDIICAFLIMFDLLAFSYSSVTFSLINHLVMHFSFCQAAAAAQAGASVIQIFVGRLRVITFLLHYHCMKISTRSSNKLYVCRTGLGTIVVTLKQKVHLEEEKILVWLWLVLIDGYFRWQTCQKQRSVLGMSTFFFTTVCPSIRKGENKLPADEHVF